jgi:replication factor A2
VDLQMRGASSTMPLTVKQVVDAQQSGTGDKGAPFIVNGVEMANVPIILLFVLWSVDMQMFSALIHLPRFPFQIRLVGMVNAKVERTTDVTFTLDDGTGRLDFIRW